MLSNAEAQRTSKFLSLVLRHKPEEIGLTLDENGWANVATLLQQMARYGTEISAAQLAYLVETNSKQRFAFSDDRTRIRASQVHSVEVELGYAAQLPPPVLYHGTTTRFLTAILAEGLKKGSQHHVHLSADQATAHNVGSRHGRPLVLTVNAAAMAAQGFPFFRSDNGVWLAETVPPQYLDHEPAQPQ